MAIFKAGAAVFSFADRSRERTLEAMERHGWAYLGPQIGAIFPLWERLLDAVREGRPMTVKHWVRGIPVRVCLPGLALTHVFDPVAGLAIDQEIAIELATFMTARSYFEGGVQVGAFVIDARLGRPPDGYFSWAKRVGLLAGQAGADLQEVALSEMARARRYYRELV